MHVGNAILTNLTNLTRRQCSPLLHLTFRKFGVSVNYLNIFRRGCENIIFGIKGARTPEKVGNHCCNLSPSLAGLGEGAVNAAV